jgi:hypothetical protein
MAARTRFSANGTMAETRVGDEEFVNFPGSFASYLCMKLEERVREDEAQEAKPITGGGQE